MTLEGEKCRRKRPFSSILPQNVNSEQTDRCLWVLKPRTRKVVLSKNSVKVNFKMASCTSQSHPALSYSHYLRAGLMMKILVTIFCSDTYARGWSFQSYSYPPYSSKVSMAKQLPHSKLSMSMTKKDVWKPKTLWNDARCLITFSGITVWLLSK